MSKSDSHQFKGTRGERIAHGKIPSNQKKKLVDWANDVIERMGKNV